MKSLVKNRVFVWNRQFDYIKNTSSTVKDASVSTDGDVAFWFENGLVKIYKRMQPTLEIYSFVGDDVAHVWAKEIAGNLITIVLVKGKGYYIFKNEQQLYHLDGVTDSDLYSERFAGITGHVFYYARSYKEYVKVNLMDFSTTVTEQSISQILKIESGNVITADACNRITVNGVVTGLNNSITYSELTERSLYLIDENGYLAKF